jgi:hypothetical protein
MSGSNPSTTANLKKYNIMKKFVKLTIRTENGNHIKKWVSTETIETLTQDSVTQWSNNEGTCVFTDGSSIELIGFNETLEGLA